MKISNLRIEKKDGFSYLTVDINTKFTPRVQLCFICVQDRDVAKCHTLIFNCVLSAYLI